MESSHVLREAERFETREGDGESRVVDVSEVKEGDYEYQVENTVDFGREREIDELFKHSQEQKNKDELIH